MLDDDETMLDDEEMVLDDEEMVLDDEETVLDDEETVFDEETVSDEGTVLLDNLDPYQCPHEDLVTKNHHG